jgi:hypothetical protein
MTISHRLSGLAIAAMTLAGGLASSQPVQAEDLVDFLWGGSAEYGGGRSVVAFDPKYKPNQVIVSFSDRRLYLITKPGEAITYPVAVPMGDARWQGVTFVSSKRVNPPWTPTSEMVRNNPRLPRWVPGGHPMNPLGVRALYLGSSAYRIHGTDAPWTIGQAVSHGCIRLTNKDVLDLYPRISVGTRVTVTWQRFSTHAIASGGGYPAYGSNASGDDDQSSSSASNDDDSSSDASSHASHAPADGSIGSLFFWDDKPAQKTAEAPEQAPDDQVSEPAPNKRHASAEPASKNESAKKEVVSAKKEASAEKKEAGAEKKEASDESAPKKEVVKKEASAEAAAAPKKKYANASANKKKPASSAEETKSEPLTARNIVVPDPVKPTTVVPAAAKAPAPEKASDAAPATTKTSASAEDVSKATVKLQ